MKLLELQIDGYKNIKKLNINFLNSDRKTLLIGKNASGKSNILEALSSIFSSLYNVEKNVKPDFRFRLNYQIPTKSELSEVLKTKYAYVSVTNVKEKIEVYYSDNESYNDLKLLPKKYIPFILPDHVIAVYSGEEMRLWNDYYFKNYDKFNKECFKGTINKEPKMLYFNHYYWELVASILAISDIDDRRNMLSFLGISKIKSISMTFDLKNIKKNQNKYLNNILDYINNEKSEGVIVDIGKYQELINICGSEEILFKYMMILCLPKDFKIITDFKILTENNIGLRELSEGEKKILLIYGAINITSGENLYLLDEPDAHLHEGRKHVIYDLINSDPKSQFIITSHSPTMAKMFNEKNSFLVDNSSDGFKVYSRQAREIVERITDGEWSLNDESKFYDTTSFLVLTEGKSDVKFISNAIEILSNEDKKYNNLNNINILQCGGTGNMHSSVDEICKIVPNEKNVIIVCDRDDAGKKVIAKFIEKDKDEIAINDDNTYKKGNKYCFMLPKKSGFKWDNFVIEDYFSEDLKKKYALNKINNSYGNMLNIPNGIRDDVKKYLSLNSFSPDEYIGFKFLLDRLLNIVNGKEKCIEIDDI